MDKNFYNVDEKKYSDLIEDLKNLPRQNAPDDFEFKLFTRIENRNFGQAIKPERIKFSFIKFFAPSAVVVSAIVIFFIFLPNSDVQIENPLMSEPKEITPTDQVLAGSIEKSTNEGVALSERGIEKRIPKGPPEVLPEVKERYPLTRNKSVVLDEYISGSAQSKKGLNRGNVVTEGGDANEFDGFFIRQDPDPNLIKKYRQMLDSLKKAQARQDSLKKANK